MNKKKYHGGYGLFFGALFCLLFVLSFTNTCNASLSEYYLPTDNQWYEIISYLNLTNFSGDNLSTTHTTFNIWMSNFITSGEFSAYSYWENHALIFSKSSNSSLQWCIVNDPGLSGSITGFFVNSSSTYNDYLSSLSVKNTFLFRGIADWIYSGNNVTGYTTENFTFYYIPAGNLTGVATSSNQSVFNAYNGLSQKISVSDISYHGVDKYGLFIPSVIGYYPYNNEPSSTHDHDFLVPVNSRTYEKEWGIYYLTKTISGEYIEPTPTPTPSGGGSPGGGGSDLSTTNGKIDEVKDAINNAFDPDTSKIDSGDISLSIENFEISSGDDPTSNFFTWVLDQIQDILTTNSDETLEFDFLGEHYTLHSNFFAISDSPLKTFLQAYFTFAVGLATALDIRRIIEHFKNGNIEAIASDDINANIV